MSFSIYSHIHEMIIKKIHLFLLMGLTIMTVYIFGLLINLPFTFDYKIESKAKELLRSSTDNPKLINFDDYQDHLMNSKNNKKVFFYCGTLYEEEGNGKSSRKRFMIKITLLSYGYIRMSMPAIEQPADTITKKGFNYLWDKNCKQV
ncbi:hypothetical protein [Providencia alcalifaciens]|uniref:hypothetical protein n=1 Tax=Providencia alcalifaciens TaxID=126385 RepID=UPI00044F503C|nr:hypothetical protein [Providencia alcalifaciens]EUD06276.1 hypothetical protein HMPREF1564_3760 [Providencia alcalifaciens R90-1475]